MPEKENKKKTIEEMVEELLKEVQEIKEMISKELDKLPKRRNKTQL